MDYTTHDGILWLCLDCTEQAEGNPRIMRGNLLTADWEGEGEGFQAFSRDWCGLCNTTTAGYRHRFAYTADN